jgi:rhomboid protease GluP
MVGTGSIIPTRSREQAYEWSLVLLSQGIESLADRDEETLGWHVEVSPEEVGRALRILRQYKVENRLRRFVQTGHAKLRFDWSNSWFFVLLVVVFALSESPGSALREWGRMDRARFLSGEWWRPITAVLLHHDLPHLLSNAGIGMLFIGLAGGVFGPVRAILISLFSGIAANVLGCLFHPGGYLALGASGIVMGALGLLTCDSILHRESTETNLQRIGRGLAAGFLLLVLLGFDPHPTTDVLAHVIGFAFGLALGTATTLYLKSHRAIRSLSAESQ